MARRKIRKLLGGKKLKKVFQCHHLNFKSMGRKFTSWAHLNSFVGRLYGEVIVFIGLLGIFQQHNVDLKMS